MSLPILPIAVTLLGLLAGAAMFVLAGKSAEEER